MKTMNLQELDIALQNICSQLSQANSNRLRQYFSATRCHIVSCKTNRAQPTEPTASSKYGQIGGSPLLPENFSWPNDRFGKPMLFLAQFNLEQLPPVENNYKQVGLLTIFRAVQASKLSRKDRKSFALHCFESPYQGLIETRHPQNIQLPTFHFDCLLTYTINADRHALQSVLTLDEKF